MLSTNVNLGRPLKATAWRKVAIGTWRSAGDPSVYGVLEMDVGPALAYIEKVKKESGVRVTLTHFIGKAVADTMRKNPEINCVLRFGKLYPRKSVDVFFQVATDMEGKDLSGSTIRNADQKSIVDIAKELTQNIHSIRTQGDPTFRKTKSTMGKLPSILTHFVVNLLGFIMYGLNLYSPLLGSPKDPFGGVMVTNIGSLGLDLAFAPLVPYSRVPLLIAVGEARDTPVVRNGKIEIAKICRLCATFDHRLIDGVHASQMVKNLTKLFADPEKEFG